MLTIKAILEIVLLGGRERIPSLYFYVNLCVGRRIRLEKYTLRKCLECTFKCGFMCIFLNEVLAFKWEKTDGVGKHEQK